MMYEMTLIGNVHVRIEVVTTNLIQVPCTYYARDFNASPLSKGQSLCSAHYLDSTSNH